MNKVNKKVINARPSLRVLDPPTFWFALGFTILNLILGVGIFMWEPTIFPVVAPNQIFMSLWGATFIGVGLTMAFAMWKRQWGLLRNMMKTGLFIKILWAVALFFRIGDGGTLLIAVIWTALAYFQALSIVFFFPPKGGLDARDDY